MKRTRWGAAVAATAVVLTVGGCGSTGKTSSSPIATSGTTASTTPATTATTVPATTTTAAPTTTAPPTTTVPKLNYGKQYLADVKLANAAIAAVPSDATVTSPSVIHLASTLQSLGRELLQQQWPASAEADVHALATEAETVAADIDEQNTSGFVSDVPKMEAAVQVVRADLGLPAAKS